MSQLPEEFKKLQFLVCDDYASMILLVTSDLRKLGVTKIITANSGNAGFEIIKKNMGTPNEIQFVLTDLMMENGTGKDMTKLIRAVPELKNLPILMISSMTDVNLMLDCVKAGISNYIVKPWNIDELVKKIISSKKK